MICVQVMQTEHLCDGVRFEMCAGDDTKDFDDGVMCAGDDTEDLYDDVRCVMFLGDVTEVLDDRVRCVQVMILRTLVTV